MLLAKACRRWEGAPRMGERTLGTGRRWSAEERRACHTAVVQLLIGATKSLNREWTGGGEQGRHQNQQQLPPNTPWVFKRTRNPQQSHHNDKQAELAKYKATVGP